MGQHWRCSVTLQLERKFCDMSEVINNTHERLERLYQFSTKLIDGENGRMLVDAFQDVISTVDATETMLVFDRLLKENYSLEVVKANTGKIINVFFQSLSARQWNKPGEGHFLHYLMLENREAEKLIADVKPAIKALFKAESTEKGDNILQIKSFINRLKDYELHYIKKENILFPYLEKTFEQHSCLHLMWSFHDDFRRILKALENSLAGNQPDLSVMNKEFGNLFFVVLPVIFREEQIIFPVAVRAIPESAWGEMLEQSREIGWCYNILPAYPTKLKQKERMVDLIDLTTGSLSAQQIILMLENLPVDITFVDENDEVRYFSGTKHRVFPRSKAIIGRKVQNCHPPESVHIVNQIVEAFRTGAKDHADFWIQMKGRFLHIRYFVLRDDQGNYKGTIEVSQDVSEIRALQGEQRLLNWDK